VENFQAGRDLSRNPIFQVAFVLQNTPESELNLIDIDSHVVKLPQVTSKFDLTLSLREHAEGISGTLNYNSDLYDHSTVERMMEHYVTLLGSAVNSADISISRLPLEINQALKAPLSITQEDTDYPRDQCVQQRFERQVELNPEAIALQYADKSMSYSQLNLKANQLAHYLIERGVQPHTFVCLSMSRSMDLLVSMLAILKAGATYVPLDDSYPHERLLYMIKDTGSPFLLTETKLQNQFEDFDGQVVCFDGEADKVARYDQHNPDIRINATDLAYIMYTSGSTGQPKGVEITHRGIMRLVCNVNYVDLGPQQHHLLLAPVSFDASTFEIWGALLNGASCSIYPERVPSLQGLQQVLRDYHITTLWLTSSLFNMVVDEAVEILQPVKQLLVGGEALSVPHIRNAIEHLPGTQLINGYGPTENTTFTCTYKIPRDLNEKIHAIPIGRPVANTQVYILDEHQRPVIAGLAGELYIGGDGLARGYLNNPDVTKEKFIPDPFSSNLQARLYKTGDRVRYLANGLIDFIGRVDQQVKIRGYRIEPGEIESCLTNHQSINKSVVRVFESGRGKELVAYLESTVLDLDEQTVKSYLASQLPEYMIPARIIKLEQLPITQNGKIDYHKLPSVSENNEIDNQHDSQPLSATEKTLINIWSELLHKQTIGRYENFFALGGHSLLATQLISRLSTQFDLDIPLRQIFTTPDVAGLANYIDQSKSNSISSIVAINQQARVGGHDKQAESADVSISDVVDDSDKPDVRDIESRLISIWEQILYHRPINRESHFFEIGGHSLLGVKLVYEIDKAFNVRLSLATLFEHPVLFQLAGAIKQNDDNSENQTMVAIKSSGSRKPFFCIHGRAEALVRYMDDEQPFYWLHHKQDGKNRNDFSIEEIARLHLAEIKTVQPEGPYNLAGFSIGGMLACEIAHQLEQAGEEVALLTLFDPTPPREEKSLQARMQQITRPNGRIAPGFTIKKAFHFIRGRWRRLNYKIRTSIDNRKIDYYLSQSKPLPPDLNVSYWVQLFKKTASQYRYPVCHSPMVIFIPEGQPHQLADMLQKLRMRWQSIATEGLDIRVVAGCTRHSHIVEEPYVQDLMGQLNEILENIDHK
jgi:amino acid adenylation domain-containing protein